MPRQVGVLAIMQNSGASGDVDENIRRDTGNGATGTVDGSLAADRRRIRQTILASDFYLLSPELKNAGSSGYVDEKTEGASR